MSTLPKAAYNVGLNSQERPSATSAKPSAVQIATSTRITNASTALR